MKLEDAKKIGVENCERIFYQKFKDASDVCFDLITKFLTNELTKNDIEQAEMKLKEINSENMEVKEDVN